MIKRKICLGEALSIIIASQLYIASGYVKISSMAVLCVENIISTLTIVLLFGPFVTKDIALKKIMYSQSEYFSSAVIALVEYVSWYKGAGMISLEVGLAIRGLCYPMSLILMLMFMRTARGSSTRNYILTLIVMLNIGDSLDYGKNFFDVYTGTLYLFFYILSSVSSDFITVCMTNRSGLPRFMFANSFYLGLCSLFVLMGFDVNIDEVIGFIRGNSRMLSLFGAITVVSKIFTALYIQKFGIVAYNTTKISSYIYFNIMKSVLEHDESWELEALFCYLAIYMATMVFLDPEETHERALGLVS